jgi:hypothetical protein
METTTPITENWSYTQLTPTRIPDGSKAGKEIQEEKEWFPASKFPTSVHVELMKRGELADHCKGLNEWDIQVSASLLGTELVLSSSGRHANYELTVGWRI